MAIKRILSILTICLSLGVSGQGFGEIIEAFEAQYSVPRRIISISTPQRKYLQGEIVNYSIRYSSAQLKPIQGRTIVQLLLIDSDGQLLAIQKVLVENGIGQGQVEIPNDLNPGEVQLVVISNHLRNFDSNAYCYHSLQIVRDQRLTSKENDFEIFIEGDSLIGFVQSRISIMGSRPNAGIAIIEDESDTIVSVRTDSVGFSQFSITPIPGKRYSILSNSGEMRSLPEVKSDGVGVRADDRQITISSSPSSLYRNRKLLLVVSGNKGFIAAEFSLKSGAVKLKADKENTGPGPFKVEVFDVEKRLLTSEIYMDGTVEVELVNENESYRQRDTVFLRMSSISSELGLSDIYSVSVFRKDLFEEALSKTSLPAYVNSKALSNEFRTSVGWQLSKLEQQNQAYTDKGYLEKFGTVRYISNDEIVPPATQMVIFLQGSKWFYQTFTLNDGTINLVLPDFSGSDEMFYLAKALNKKRWQKIKIDWQDDPVDVPPIKNELKATETFDQYAAFKSRKNLIDKSFRFFTDTTTSNASFESNSFESVITESNTIYDLKEYYPFKEMKEWIKEVFAPMYYRRQSGRDVLRIKTGPMMEPTDNPVFIIDDYATIDVDYFLSLDPSEIESVGFVHKSKSLLRLGVLGRNGIVIVKSKKGNLAPDDDDFGKKIIGFGSLQEGVGSEETKPLDSRVPDINSVIYWNANVRSDGELSFRLGDDLSPMVISIEGVNKRGELMRLLKELSIKE